MITNIYKDINILVDLIKKSEIVAFPTETVYGIGANIFDEVAAKKIYKIKKRPFNKPLVAHIANIGQINNFAFGLQIAYDLLDSKLPIGVILKKKNNIPNIVTSNTDTIGIRIPNNKIAIDFLTQCKVPLCATSANLAYHISTTSAKQVFDEFGNNILGILDGGECEYGLESTIIDLTQYDDNGNIKPILLRQGCIRKEIIEKKFSLKLEVSNKNNIISNLNYKKKLVIVSKVENQKLIIEKLYNEKAVILSCGINFVDKNLLLSNNKKDYAHNLYKYLREAEKKYNLVIVQGVDTKGIGKCIMEKLNQIKNVKTINKSKRKRKLVKNKKSVVFVCTGNTCRSPLAEYIFRDYCKKNKLDFVVSSAGLMACEGEDMMENAKEALRKLNIPIEKEHKSKLLTQMQLKADLIVCMTQTQKKMLNSKNVKTIGELTGGKDLDDPFGLDLNVYLNAAEYLAYACEDIVKYLCQK